MLELEGPEYYQVRSDHTMLKAFTAWLTERALSRVGLVLSHPTTVDVLRLGQQLGATDMNPLAAVEGALGREGPNEAECAIAGNGPTVQLEYDV